MSEEETIATLEGMKDGYSFRECELCEDDCTTCKCVELVAIETMLDLYSEEKEKNKEAEKQGYIKGSNATHEIWKEIIKERLEQNKAKTDCTYCNNTCDSYAVCMFCKEILEEK